VSKKKKEKKKKKKEKLSQLAESKTQEQNTNLVSAKSE
jgi:hypothetical protein